MGKQSRMKSRKAVEAKSAKSSRSSTRDVYVARPFEGLAGEVEWIALRELVPAATARLRLAEPYAEKYPDREVQLATVLPMAWPAMVRPGGAVLVGLQRQFQSGDVSRDVAAALLRALETEPGEPVSVPALPGPGPRLQDVLADDPLEVTLHDSYGFWLEPDAESDPNVQASLERANASIYPTVRLEVAPGAYWCQVSDRAHVRWVMPEPEDAVLDALARLSAAHTLLLGDGTKFAGMFRAHGLLVPVWDLPRDTPAAVWEQPLTEFAARYREALGDSTSLTSDQRRARHGLLGRQLTLR